MQYISADAKLKCMKTYSNSPILSNNAPRENFQKPKNNNY